MAGQNDPPYGLRSPLASRRSSCHCAQDDGVVVRGDCASAAPTFKGRRDRGVVTS